MRQDRLLIEHNQSLTAITEKFREFRPPGFSGHFGSRYVRSHGANAIVSSPIMGPVPRPQPTHKSCLCCYGTKGFLFPEKRDLSVLLETPLFTVLARSLFGGTTMAIKFGERTNGQLGACSIYRLFGDTLFRGQVSCQQNQWIAPKCPFYPMCLAVTVHSSAALFSDRPFV